MSRAPHHDTLAEIRAIRRAQRERGWKLIALDIEAFERAEGEAKREALCRESEIPVGRGA